MSTRVITGETKVSRVVVTSTPTALVRILVRGAQPSHKALHLKTGQPITAKVVASASSSFVKKVTIGTPVKRVSSGNLVDVNTLQVSSLKDTDVATLNDGSVLVYNISSSKWKSTTILDKQDITGGQY